MSANHTLGVNQSAALQSRERLGVRRFCAAFEAGRTSEFGGRLFWEARDGASGSLSGMRKRQRTARTPRRWRDSRRSFRELPTSVDVAVIAFQGIYPGPPVWTIVAP